MQVSIKVVIAGLLVIASFATIVACFLPTAIQLQSDVMAFVNTASVASTDIIEQLLHHRLRRMELATDVLYRAAKGRDLLDDLRDPWKLFDWVAPVVEHFDIGVLLALPNGNGLRINYENAAIKQPGYVFMTNLTAPGSYVDVGHFHIFTHTPAIPQQPWLHVDFDLLWNEYSGTRDAFNTTYERSSLLLASKYPMMWRAVTPVNIYPSYTTRSTLGIGGPVLVLSAQDPNRQLQFLFVEQSGEWLNEFFAEVNLTANGAAILVDVVSGAYVSGSVSDPTGTVVNNEPQLLPAAELKDQRIAPILHAEVVSSPSRAPPTAIEAIMTCKTPCTLTYWPHRNQLCAGKDRGPRLIDMLLHRMFTVVRVVQVGRSDMPAMSLRLIVTTPSHDVVGSLVDAIRMSMLFLVVVAGVATVLAVISIWGVFYDLSQLEVEMQRLSAQFSTPAKVLLSGCTNDRHPSFKLRFTFVKEHSSIAQSLLALTNELLYLQAFSQTPSAAYKAAPTASPGTGPWFGTAVRKALTQDCAPYDCVPSSLLWRVPVTSLVIGLTERVLGTVGDDIVDTHRRRFAVLDVVLRLSTAARGTTFAQTIVGDRFLIHFNAAARAPRHVITAVRFAFSCHKGIAGALADVPSLRSHTHAAHFGIGTAVAHCGVLGRPHVPTFTVVSVGVDQAAFMCRLAIRYSRRVMLTWRSVNAAHQQQQQQRNGMYRTAACGSPVYAIHEQQEEFDEFVFSPVATVLSPGEGRTPSVAYTAD